MFCRVCLNLSLSEDLTKLWVCIFGTDATEAQLHPPGYTTPRGDYVSVLLRLELTCLCCCRWNRGPCVSSTPCCAKLHLGPEINLDLWFQVESARFLQASCAGATLRLCKWPRSHPTHRTRVTYPVPGVGLCSCRQKLDVVCVFRPV